MSKKSPECANLFTEGDPGFSIATAPRSSSSKQHIFRSQTIATSHHQNPIKSSTIIMASIDVEKQPLLDAPKDSSEAEAQEPSLAELQQNVFKAQREYMKAWSRTTSGTIHKRIMWAVTALVMLFAGFCIALILMDTFDDDAPMFTGRVPLEAHIMSKCPDARDCLHDMILPAMQNVSHKVDFKLSYIGTFVCHQLGR